MPIPASKDSRDFILGRIRRALPQSAPLPEVLNSPEWQTFPDPAARFAEVLGSVGGQVVRCSSLHQAHQHLESMPLWNTAWVKLPPQRPQRSTRTNWKTSTSQCSAVTSLSLKTELSGSPMTP
jgi:hypothetical protein